MYVDAQLTFSDAQAITATANSTNVIDTGPLFSGITGRNLGVGRQLYIAVTVDVAFTDSGSDSTIAISLVTDDNAALSSASTIASLGTLAALTPAGTSVFFPMPLPNTVPYERYIALTYTAANGSLTTGSITASIVLDIDAYTSTVGGFTTGT